MAKKKKIRVVLIVSLVIILIGAGLTTFLIYKSNKEKEQIANLMYEEEMEVIYDDIAYEFKRIEDELMKFENFVHSIRVDTLSDDTRFLIFGEEFIRQTDIQGYENRRLDLEDRVNNLKSPSEEMYKVNIALKKYMEKYTNVQMNFTDFNNYDYKAYKAKMDNLMSECRQANIELLEHRKKVIERRIYGK